MVLLPKRYFSFLEDFRLGDLFELVVKRGLQNLMYRTPFLVMRLARNARRLSSRRFWARTRARNFDCVIADHLGDLDNADIAEFTFKDRHKQSGDRVIGDGSSAAEVLECRSVIHWNRLRDTQSAAKMSHTPKARRMKLTQRSSVSEGFGSAVRPSVTVAHAASPESWFRCPDRHSKQS